MRYGMTMAAALAAAACGAIAAPQPPALAPVRMQDVKVSGFWRDQYKKIVCRWIPHCIKQMEKGGRGEELLNLVATGEVLAGKTPSVKFKGCPWSDAYPYNTVEAMCLALELDPAGDAELAAGQDFLRAKLEEWIPIILAAQEPSGYIHSYHDLRRKPHFTRPNDHEFYVMGYFIEMGVAHYRMTKGRDRRLYDAAIRCADHLDSVFGPAPKRTWLNGHPGLEYALWRLAESVNISEGAGKGEKYARLAQHFVRGQHAAGKAIKAADRYNQSDMPAEQMKDAAGHAVRATYFYAAMSALAEYPGDAPLGAAADRLFESAIDRKGYITGGVGAAWRGEAFAGDYELDNRGYCESCASCGMAFWAGAQHRRHGDARSAAVLERLVYNNLLGSISADGKNFFYQNPLDSDKTRYPWHVCPCCVGNIPRTLLALKDMAYSVSPSGGTLFADQFIGLDGAAVRAGGAAVRIRQETDYPQTGKIKYTLSPERPAEFTFAIRIPDRTESKLYKAVPDVSGRFALSVNGAKFAAESKDGYVRVKREWKAGDVVEIEFPVPVQRVYCDKRVKANSGRVAFQRGPVVYSFEQIDNPGRDMGELAIPADAKIEEFAKKDLCGGVTAIRCGGATGVPNYARLNRGKGRCITWAQEKPAKRGPAAKEAAR